MLQPRIWFHEDYGDFIILETVHILMYSTNIYLQYLDLL